MITESNTIEELGNLGTLVKFNQILEDVYINSDANNKYLKRWELVTVPETYGVLIGFRTVYEGVLKQKEDYNFRTKQPKYYGYLKRTKGIYHALVSYHPRRNPVRVPLPIKYVVITKQTSFIY